MPAWFATPGQLAAIYADNPEESTPHSCGGDRAATTGAHRFFNYDRGEFSAIRAGHCRAPLRRIAGRDFILIVQDTSTMEFTKRHAARARAAPAHPVWPVCS